MYAGSVARWTFAPCKGNYMLSNILVLMYINNMKEAFIIVKEATQTNFSWNKLNTTTSSQTLGKTKIAITIVKEQTPS